VPDSFTRSPGKAGIYLPERLGLFLPIRLMRLKAVWDTLDSDKGIINMSIFTNNELDYLQKQKLGRLATVDVDGNPHVVPVGFRYDSEADSIDIGGHNLDQSKKWRDAGRHPRVAFVVDDVLPPWQPRSITIEAEAERLEQGGERFGLGFDPQIMRLHPIKIIAWGIDPKRQSRMAKNEFSSQSGS
jgi:pyridoxamine 5'-phosphate oxidase family protein